MFFPINFFVRFFFIGWSSYLRSSQVNWAISEQLTQDFNFKSLLNKELCREGFSIASYCFYWSVELSLNKSCWGNSHTI